MSLLLANISPSSLPPSSKMTSTTQPLSGSYDHETSPAAEDVAQKIIEVSGGLKRMASLARADDLKPLIAEVKKVAGAIKAMELDVETIGKLFIFCLVWFDLVWFGLSFIFSFLFFFLSRSKT